MAQDGKDKDMARDQEGKDMDSARGEGEKQADHERQMEVEKKKVKKESVDSKIEDTLKKLKRRVLAESGGNAHKLTSIDRIISRNTGNHQNNG